MKKINKIAATLLLCGITAVNSITVFAGTGTWNQDTKGWWYAYDDNSYSVNKWEQVNGSWYRFDNSGYMQTGWMQDGGNWYYLGNTGVMQTGWVQSGGNWYYISNSGAMQTGWIKQGESWYYLNNAGAMQIGWIQQGNDWYYMDGNGAMVVGSRTINGTAYSFGSDGRMAETSKQKTIIEQHIEDAQADFNESVSSLSGLLESTLTANGNTAYFKYKILENIGSHSEIRKILDEAHAEAETESRAIVNEWKSLGIENPAIIIEYYDYRGSLIIRYEVK
jgi:FOG: Glucan-binding domain (YG repeat)